MGFRQAGSENEPHVHLPWGASRADPTAPLCLPGEGVRPERWLVLLILSNHFFLVFVFIFTFLDDSRHLLNVFGCDH